MVMARPDAGDSRRQHVVRLTRDGAGGLAAALICPCRLQPIVPGRSRAL
jgi:protein-L-isoaspartate(D-aspartate) O-methyltransferase